MLSNSLRSSARKVVDQQGARGTFYERIMQVDFIHLFYNASGYRCPCFNVFPTQVSLDRMAATGMLFRAESTEFSVLLNNGSIGTMGNEQRFFSYLREHKRYAPSSPAPHEAVWTHLSFILTLRQTNFMNVTQLPLNVRAGVYALYLSNRKTTVAGDGTVGFDTQQPEFLPLTGPQYLVQPQPEDQARSIVVRDISGRIVIREPVYWPSNFPADWKGPTAPSQWPDENLAAETDFAMGQMNKRVNIFLSFSQLPEGRYTIEQYSRFDGPYNDPLSTQDVLYVVSASSCVCFIDLLFTDPGIDLGTYPVRKLFDPEETTLDPVVYNLVLGNRSTIWNYYLVPRDKTLYNLSIVQIAPDSPQKTFSGPTLVQLPGSQPAYLLTSTSSIPLLEQSTFNFQLLGNTIGTASEVSVLFSRLPVASGQQVIPGVNDFATATDRGISVQQPAIHNDATYSDIYAYI